MILPEVSSLQNIRFVLYRTIHAVIDAANAFAKFRENH